MSARCTPEELAMSVRCMRPSLSHAIDDVWMKLQLAPSPMWQAVYNLLVENKGGRYT
jgi:hypothetical protein